MGGQSTHCRDPAESAAQTEGCTQCALHSVHSTATSRSDLLVVRESATFSRGAPRPAEHATRPRPGGGPVRGPTMRSIVPYIIMHRNVVTPVRRADPVQILYSRLSRPPFLSTALRQRCQSFCCLKAVFKQQTGGQGVLVAVETEG